MGGLHLYCVVGDGTKVDGELVGLDGQRVAGICHRDLTAVVSPAPVRPYRTMRREEVLRCLALHQAVLEHVMARHTVVPVKFGITVRHEAEARKILKKGYKQFSAILDLIEGLIEIDLVAQWSNLDVVVRTLGEEPRIQAQKAAIAQTAVQETAEARVALGKLVKARLDQARDERAAEIVCALRPLVHDWRAHAPMDDRVILNAALLVEEAKEPSLGEVLEWLNRRYAGTINFRCVGPLPPYSFAAVEIRTFEFQAVDRARRLLSLGTDAVPAEIRAAYCHLIQDCHPDRAARQTSEFGNAEHFQELTAAYKLLGEYRQIGRSFRAADVEDTVAVTLFHSSSASGSG